MLAHTPEIAKARARSGLAGQGRPSRFGGAAVRSGRVATRSGAGVLARALLDSAEGAPASGSHIFCRVSQASRSTPRLV